MTSMREDGPAGRASESSEKSTIEAKTKQCHYEGEWFILCVYADLVARILAKV